MYKSYKYLSNSTLVLAAEYARGVEDALDGFKKAQKRSTDTIANLVESGEDRQDSLRNIYTSRIDGVEKTWNIRCKLCKQYTENERIRLRRLQSYASKFIHDFTSMYGALLRHVEFVSEANNKILTSAATLKDSQTRLERLKKAVDRAVTEAEPLMRLTEEDLSAKERAGIPLHGYKPGTPIADGRGGKGPEVVSIQDKR